MEQAFYNQDVTWTCSDNLILSKGALISQPIKIYSVKVQSISNNLGLSTNRNTNGKR